MKHALAFAASVAAGALAVGVAPAAADLPVAGNSANDSIGTVQVGPTVAGAAAVVTTQDATAAAVVVVPTMGDGGNTADHSIGTVQSGGGNDARRSAGTVQVGGGNSAEHSIGTVQVSSVRVSPQTHVDVRPAGVELRLGGHVGVADGHNSARHSVGTVQAGGIELAPEVLLNVGPLASIWLGGGSSISGTGGNSADDSIGTVQLGGGNGATPGGGSGGGGTSGSGASGSGEHSLASAAQSGGVNPVTQKAPRAAPAKNNTTAFRPPASRPSATRQIQGTVARPTSSVQGSSLPFTGLTLASFLGGALALALLGSLLRRAALPVR